MGHVGCLLYALDTGGDVNYGPLFMAGLYGEEMTKRTPLIAAVEYNQDHCVEILIKAGADVNKVSQYLDTPLTVAVKKRNQKHFKMLLEAGADVNIKILIWTLL